MIINTVHGIGTCHTDVDWISSLVIITLRNRRKLIINDVMVIPGEAITLLSKASVVIEN